MSASRLLLALAFGSGMTLLLFFAVGALNNATVASRDALIIERQSRPVIVTPPPEPEAPSPAPPSVLKTVSPNTVAPTSRLQASALPSLRTASTRLGLGSVLPELGDVVIGNLGVSETSTQPDRPARAQRTVAPDYPASARRDGIEGYVVVRLSIDIKGRVQSVIVVDSEPMGIFDSSARNAARRFEFVPARLNGQAVPTHIEKKIIFTLK